MNKKTKSDAPPTSIIGYRKWSLQNNLTNEVGVYALCDLDGVPIYVGQTHDGIRSRVYRHLTSARSDIIANRLVDVWEMAYVKAWPVTDLARIFETEATLFHFFDRQSPLMNGSVPAVPAKLPKKIPAPTQTVTILPPEEIEVRRDPALRLPRQIEHLGRFVDHLLSVKDTRRLRRAMAAHFIRLDTYRAAFLGAGAPVVRRPGESDDEDADD